MIYIRYEDFVQRGGMLDSTAFNRFAIMAGKIIDMETHSRVHAMQTIPEAVTDCTFELIMYLSKHDYSSGTVTSRSQTAGNVSESESYAVKSADESDAEMRDIVARYLLTEKDDNGTPLMCRGYV